MLQLHACMVLNPSYKIFFKILVLITVFSRPPRSNYTIPGLIFALHKKIHMVNLNHSTEHKSSLKEWAELFDQGAVLHEVWREMCCAKFRIHSREKIILYADKTRRIWPGIEAVRKISLICFSLIWVMKLLVLVLYT